MTHERKVRVAVVSQSVLRRALIKEGLRRHGLEVAMSCSYDEALAGVDGVDTMLLVLDEAPDDGTLDTLLGAASMPVLFHEHDAAVEQDTRRWAPRLAAKLHELGAAAARESAQADPPVWVLASSAGGPQAVRRFLTRLPGDLPVALILVQHLGHGFGPLLTDQLRPATRFKVLCAEPVHRLRAGHAVVIPAERGVVVPRRGWIELTPPEPGARYSPSIDTVLTRVAKCYGADSGAILFSGMRGEGVEGGRALLRAGGLVWAQDAATAVVSSMVDDVRDAGLVHHSGPPEALADALVDHVEQRFPRTSIANLEQPSQPPAGAVPS